MALITYLVLVEGQVVVVMAALLRLFLILVQAVQEILLQHHHLKEIMVALVTMAKLLINKAGEVGEPAVLVQTHQVLVQPEPAELVLLYLLQDLQELMEQQVQFQE